MPATIKLYSDIILFWLILLTAEILVTCQSSLKNCMPNICIIFIAKVFLKIPILFLTDFKLSFSSVTLHYCHIVKHCISMLKFPFLQTNVLLVYVPPVLMVFQIFRHKSDNYKKILDKNLKK